jgi:hypothetical protein
VVVVVVVVVVVIAAAEAEAVLQTFEYSKCDFPFSPLTQQL